MFDNISHTLIFSSTYTYLLEYKKNTYTYTAKFVHTHIYMKKHDQTYMRIYTYKNINTNTKKLKLTNAQKKTNK